MYLFISDFKPFYKKKMFSKIIGQEHVKRLSHNWPYVFSDRFCVTGFSSRVSVADRSVKNCVKVMRVQRM